jgi:carbon-monoxide dehydrogenase large subunit
MSTSPVITETASHTDPWVGRPLQRFEDQRLLTGQARFIADLPLPPRTLHAAFVRADRPHAQIVRIDSTRARELPGVMAVLSASELEAEPLVDPTSFYPKTPQSVLACDVVRFQGEAITVVVATSQAVAEDAAELVEVAYNDLPRLLDVPSALDAGAPILHDHLDSNVLYSEHRIFGEVDAAFAAADCVYQRRLETNRLSACPLEMRGCLASFAPANGSLSVWSPSQSPHQLQLALADSMQLPASVIRVIVPDVGGAFGAKIPTAPEEVAVCCASRLLGRPVRWVESRSEYLAAGTHAKQQIIEMQVAVTHEGDILGLRGSFTGDAGAYSFNSVSALIEPQRAASMMTSAYDIPACEYEFRAVLTNKSPIAPYRGVGFTSAQTVRELLFDDAARGLGIDPADFRLRNIISDQSFPYECVTGAVYDSGAYHKGAEMALDLVRYTDMRSEQTRLRAEGRYIGVGISPFVEHTAKGSEISTQTGWPYSSHDNATVTIGPGGDVRVAVNAVAQGQGHETTFAQIAADELGVSPGDVHIVVGDTETTPFGMGTWGSRSTVIAGGAVILAAQDVRGKLLEVAGFLLDADVDHLVLHDSKIEVLGMPAQSLPLAHVAKAAYWNKDLREKIPNPYLSSTRFYDPRATYTGGCVVAVAEVDIETGESTVTRFAVIDDCGKRINPAIIRGQVHGAAAQAIGSALCEGHRYGDDGRLLTTSLVEYTIPRASDVPNFELDHLETPSPVTVGGFKGIGEGVMVGGPAAVICAVVDALAPFTPNPDLELPLTSEHVLRAINRI